MFLPPCSFLVSGSVIIENGRVLLNKARGPDNHLGQWHFPGGRVENCDSSLAAAARREAKEEMGIELEIIRPLSTLLIKQAGGSLAILAHYLAARVGEIRPGGDIAEWAWSGLDGLPADLAPNIRPIIQEVRDGLK